MDIEKDLRSALRRESAPPGFAARVMERATREPVRAARPRMHWRAIAATLMLTAILGGWTAHSIAERREGERARDQVLLALRIAGAKVRYAQIQVQQIGSKGAVR